MSGAGSSKPLDVLVYCKVMWITRWQKCLYQTRADCPTKGGL